MTHPTKLTVAAAQYPLDLFADLGAYCAKLERWVADGAATGARLLVFPEYGAMELAGAAGTRVASDLAASLAAVSASIPALDAAGRHLARQHGAHILMPSGPVRRDDGRYVNAARLITPSGAVGVQDKCIMTPFERDWGIAPGGPLRVFETSLGRIAIAICYDCEFPLQVRAAAEAGAELLLIPSCTERLSGLNRVRTGAMARALENGIACVTSPTVGEALWSPAVDRNTGAAGIFVPAEEGVSDTGVLAEGRINEPGWVTADIDLARLRRLRQGGEMHNVADWSRQPGAGAPAAAVEVVRM